MKKELMKKYDMDELKKLQQAELEILKEVLKICKKANIDCFLWGGTAIGAERHGGFIPWDDDVDVIMLRDDYDKFLETAPKLLPGDLFLQNHNTDRNCPCYFTKIRKNNTIFLEKYAMHKKMHHGIFIDVFVLDTIPENVKERKLFFIKNRFLVQLYLAKHLTTSFTADVNPLKVFVRKFLHFLLFPISSDFLYRQLDNHAKKYHDDHSKYLHQSGRDHKMPYIYTKNDFSGKRKILFESVEAYVPAGNHTILTYRYGDYMKIPPEEYRYNHRPVKIEFEVSGFSQEQRVNNPLKICILTPRFPFPENGGDVLRINNISRYLKSKGHTLVLVSYCTQKDIDNQDNITDPLYDRIYYIKRNTFVSLGMSFWAFLLNKPIQIGYYFSFTYLAKFKKTIKEEKPDLYISHLLRMVPFLNLCRLQDKSIVEMTDALSKTYGMSGNVLAFSLKRIIYLIERKRIAAYERRTIAKYKKCVLVSQMDKDYLESYGTLLKAD